MTTPLGDFGLPPDAVAWSAAVLGLVALVGLHPLIRGALARIPDRALIAALALVAVLSSAGYVVFYLRGGPRIVDATTYWLEARVFAEGGVSFEPPGPSGSFRGRFLLASPDGDSIAPIFPPGYPAVLALGFLLGRPLLVGPIIAGALVVVTYRLSLALFPEAKVARLAALCSVLCAVLRYHTADTMSHGWSALLLATALLGVLQGSATSAALGGACAGWLFATRPASGLVVFLGAALWLFQERRRGRRAGLRTLAFALAGVLPVALFFVHQRAITGEPWRSVQMAYYAVADGPPGCFRYGFGTGIGCHFEHGDFVRANLPDGYGLVAALGTTLRRLKMHLADALNVELGLPLVAYAMLRVPEQARVARWILVGFVLAYAPFYFDGNYPGGGARFFADALPLEHALIAFAAVRLGRTPWVAPLALLGFALHTSYDHRRLGEREGGRPMFEPAVVAASGLRAGLLLVDTDHGFSIGHDPAQRDAQSGVVVARRRGDAHDRLLWEQLGRPAAAVYEYDVTGSPARPRVSPWEPAAAGLRFEAEAEWPPLSVRDGWAEPGFPPCASGGRALVLHPATPGTPVVVRLAAPPARGMVQLTARWASGRSASRAVVSVVTPTGRVARTLELPAGACETTEFGRSAWDSRAAMEITSDHEVMLDFVELSPGEEP